MSERKGGKVIRRRRQRRRRMVKRMLAFLVVLVVVMFVHQMYARYGGVDEAKLREEHCPESLIELAKRNPEAREFVYHFATRADEQQDMDVSKEIQEGEIPLFLQWDERWGYTWYGDDYMAVTGCGPTCLSMVCCGLSGDASWNPYRVALLAEEEGYYVDGSGSSWSIMTEFASEMGLMVSEVSFDEESILSELQQGRPIICVMGPGDFTTTGHFIVLVGVDDRGEIMIRDPNSKKNSNKTWALEDLMPQIRNLWSYRYA